MTRLGDAPVNGETELSDLERGSIEYIIRKTGLDRGTVVRVLTAEKEFLLLQIKKALHGGDQR
ncbi:hypothetical protein [Thermococcus sp.]|uniref:hypothetical protein n=1 Tax=Thermococcus sp. TaxID=35749 RepID=UPI0026195410|nr:hypothetical protein [Thermococcus sp.]